MTIVAERYAHVIGVDTHARTHTYAILETRTGAVTATATFPTSAPGISRALAWIARRAPGDAIAAVEGTASYGAGLTRAFDLVGIPVAEARPPKRATRAGRGKSDQIDAEAAARTVLAQDTAQLLTPRSGKIRSALRVLLVARRQIDTHRTLERNALNALARVIDLGIDARRPLTDLQIAQIASWRARASDNIEEAVARTEASRLARNIRHATTQLESNLEALRTHVQQLAPALLDVFGIGPVTAAVFITAYSHPGRVRSEAAFASLAGAAPIPASSGNTTRHRLNRHGDRALNAALDTVARVRLAADPTTRAYKERRLAEGKTPREIRRQLKRYIARQLYRKLATEMTPTS